MIEKPLVWLGTSLTRLRAFPEDARRACGYQLWFLQQGLVPEDWKTVPSVGPGVCEIRIHSDLEHRVLYVAKFSEAIYVLHVFQKGRRRMPKMDMELARRRYAELVRHRRTQQGARS